MSVNTEETMESADKKEIKKSTNTKENQPSLFEEIDDFSDRLMADRWSKPFSWLFPVMKNVKFRSEVRIPSVDVVEKNNNIIVRTEIPGIDKKDIEITLNGDNITIQGTTKHETKEVTEEYHRCEISAGSFRRTLTLPSEVDGDNVKATFVNGLLEVALPKVEKGRVSKVEIE